MHNHTFLFLPGNWLGEGKIKLNMMDEQLPFFTRWKIAPVDDSGRIESLQEIQISGMAETMHNEFSLFDLISNQFHIELENQNLGKIVGEGLINPKKVGWEFRMPQLGFEGFEFYEKKDEENYLFHAEYATKDEFRTEIHGRIWKQTAISNKEGETS